MSARDAEPVPAGRPFGGAVVLVLGAGRCAEEIARAARERGAHMALAAPQTEAGVDELFDRPGGELPRLDAAILVVRVQPLGPVHDMPAADWRERVADPLRIVWWLARRVTEEFLANAVGGRLVIVLDTDGNGCNDVVQQALEAFARSYAREYGRRDLACNLVAPARADGTHGDAVHTRRAIVEHALFLASPSASFVNGETFPVDVRDRPAAPQADALF